MRRHESTLYARYLCTCRIPEGAPLRLYHKQPSLDTA